MSQLDTPSLQGTLKVSQLPERKRRQLHPPGGSPDARHDIQPMEAQLGAWRTIWPLAAKPMRVERYLPREVVSLWQLICLDALQDQVPLSDVGQK